MSYLSGRQLRKEFEHGTRSRYANGCRREACRKANRDYERGRIAARRDGDWNGLVDAGPARRHLLKLMKAGVGRRTVERLTGVANSVVQGVKTGQKTRIRARTAKLLLAVTEVYTRAPIAGELGYCDPCWKEKRHLCFATSKPHGVPKCDACAQGLAKCDYHTGSGWYRGDGSKGMPSDMTPVKKLAAKRPHGHFMRYKGGCRCKSCREAARAYNEKLRANRILLGPNNLVPTDEVKAYLIKLQAIGVGHQTVAKYTGVGKTGLAEILWNGKTQMRRRAANAVLAFKPSLDTFPKKKLVPARDTVAKIERMVKWGIPRTFITHDALGKESQGLQIQSLKGRTNTTTVRTAIAIRDYFARVQTIRELWVSTRGRIPSRHYVYWKPGRTTEPLSIHSIELRPFAVTYDYATLPPDLKQVIQLTGALKRKIRNHTHGKEQTDGSKRPPVRDVGDAEGREQRRSA